MRLSRLFGVSTDTLLLDDAPFPPPAVQAAGSRRRWELIGGSLASSLAATGLLILGICASIFPAVYIEAPMDKEWVRAYSGLSGFLMTNNLCWLFWLLCLTLAGGLAALFRPQASAPVRTAPPSPCAQTALPAPCGGIKKALPNLLGRAFLLLIYRSLRESWPLRKSFLPRREEGLPSRWSPWERPSRFSQPDFFLPFFWKVSVRRPLPSTRP